MHDNSKNAIRCAMNNPYVFCKFLSANDTGDTGGHQVGMYIPNKILPDMFGIMPVRGENIKTSVHIYWQDGYETDSRVTYYGAVKNESRITCFGRSFPFLNPDYTGALFILVKDCEYRFFGFVLNTDDEINNFLNSFGITPTNMGQLIKGSKEKADKTEDVEIDAFIKRMRGEFPDSKTMSFEARKIQDAVYDHKELVILNPDRKLLDWTDMEYKLFHSLECAKYGQGVKEGFASIDEFIELANEILNRRKSRAGKSLEHHLSEIFKMNGLLFQEQAITENKKKPDFIFPSQDAYLNPDFPLEKLTVLAAKTTCKDRWRQILNEANRLRDGYKYLCTLQQGISPMQMDEMKAEKVILVVPKPYISSYPAEKRQGILTIHDFIHRVKALQDRTV